MKKIISIILSITLLLQSSSFIYAIDDNIGKEPYIEINEYWSSYSILDDEKRIGIMAYNNDEVIAVAFHYFESPEFVYQWIITDNDDFDYENPKDSDWAQIVRYAEQNEASSDVLEIKKVRIDDNAYTSDDAEQYMMRNSAGNELRSQLTAIYGDPYSGSLLGTYLRGGKTVRIYEDMTFTITEMGTTGWGAPLSLAAIITGYLDEVITSTLVHALSIILNVADTMYAIADPNTIIRI